MKKYTIQLIHALSVGSGAGLIEIDVDSYTCDSISAPFPETMHEGKAISIPVHNIKAIVHNEPKIGPNEIAEMRRRLHNNEKRNN